MAKSEKMSLEDRVRKFLATNVRNSPDAILSNFDQIIAEIIAARFESSRRDEIVSNLAIAVMLLFPRIEGERKSEFLLKFIEQISLVRESEEVLFGDDFCEKFSAALAELELDSLSRVRAENLLYNLDRIGAKLTHAKAPRFLEKVLGDFAHANYKKRGWAKEVGHFLVHAKNIGLLEEGSISAENRALLTNLVKDLGLYLERNNPNLGFSQSDAGAILDVFIYCQQILGIDIPKSHKAIIHKVIASEAPIISEAQREIFNKIVRFLGREQEEGAWSHVAARQGENLFVYGGIIIIELEGVILEEGGTVLKTADIVVRNIKTGEILMVIEVDGPSHSFGVRTKTARTEARDAVERSIVGAGNFLVVNVDAFDLFRDFQAAAYDAQAEVDFLRALKRRIDREIEVAETLPRQEMAQGAFAAVAAGSLSDSSALSSELTVEVVLPEVVIAKTLEEIKAELMSDFKEALLKKNVEVINEIISDPRFNLIEMTELHEFLDGQSPFDIVLSEFNGLLRRESSPQDQILLAITTLQLLWINGFEVRNRGLIDERIEYPQELRASLGLAALVSETRDEVAVSDLNRLVARARANDFEFVEKCFAKRDLPQELDDISKRYLLMILKFSARSNNSLIFNSIAHKPWYDVLKKELFVDSLKKNDCAVVVYFMNQERDLLAHLFQEDQSLSQHVRRLGSSHISNALVSMFDLPPDPRGAKKESVRRASDRGYVRSVLQRKEKSASDYVVLATIYFEGLLGAPSLSRASKVCREGRRKFPNSIDLKIVQANIAEEMGKTEEALEICRGLDHTDPSICYEISRIFANSDIGKEYLEKAASLGHPKSTGLIAVQYFYGMFGRQKDIIKAFDFAQRAVALGDIESYSNLGGFYSHMNQQEVAIYFFKQACEKGSATGALNLALCYENGEGVPKDNKMALSLYMKASQIGFDPNDDVKRKESYTEEAILRLREELVLPSTTNSVGRAAAAPISSASETEHYSCV